MARTSSLPRLPLVAEGEGGESCSDGGTPSPHPASGTPKEAPRPSGRFVRWANSIASNGGGDGSHVIAESSSSPHDPQDAADNGLRYRGGRGGYGASRGGAADANDAFPCTTPELHSRDRPAASQVLPQLRGLGPKPLAQRAARAARAVAATALLLSSGLGALVVAVCLYLTVRPWSRSVYRRMLCAHVEAPLVDAAALLLPRTCVCITGDSDMLDGLCPGAIVSNKVAADAGEAGLDCWCVLLVARAVGVHGHVKVLVPQRLAQLPVLGWLLRLLEFPTLALGSNYQQHRDELRGALASFADDAAASGVPYLFLHFPEGESFSRKSLESSLDFARREGRPELRHLLLPHTTALTAALDGLRAASPVVYDVTLAARGFAGGVPERAPRDINAVVSLLIGDDGNAGSNGSSGVTSGGGSGCACCAGGGGGAGGNLGAASTPPSPGLALSGRAGAMTPANGITGAVTAPPPSPTPGGVAFSPTASSSSAGGTSGYATCGGGSNGYAGGSNGYAGGSSGYGTTAGAAGSSSAGWGRGTLEVHMRIKKYSLEEVLGNAHWLDDRWAEKERLLHHFATHGCFPAGGRGFPARRTLDTHSPQFVGSLVAALRLSLVPLALPLAMLLALPAVIFMGCAAVAWHAVSRFVGSLLRRLFRGGKLLPGLGARGGSAEGEEDEGVASPVSSRPTTPWWGGPSTPLNTPAPGTTPGGAHYMAARGAALGRGAGGGRGTAPSGGRGGRAAGGS